MDKVYLGDGVYLNFLPYGLELTTENGIEATNRIVLEPDVYEALVMHVNRRAKHENEPTCKQTGTR